MSLMPSSSVIQRTPGTAITSRSIRASAPPLSPRDAVARDSRVDHADSRSRFVGLQAPREVARPGVIRIQRRLVAIISDGIAESYDGKGIAWRFDVDPRQPIPRLHGRRRLRDLRTR